MLILYANLFLSDVAIPVLDEIRDLGVTDSSFTFHTRDTVVCACVKSPLIHKMFYCMWFQPLYICLYMLTISMSDICQNTLHYIKTFLVSSLLEEHEGIT